MGIRADEIREAQEAVRRYGNKTAAALALKKPRSWLRRRIDAGQVAPVPKPRVRVPYNTEPVSFTSAAQYRPEPLYSPNAPVTPPSNAVIRVLAIGDLHDDPYLSKERFRWIGKFAADIQPDRIVQIGDIADFESLSFHSGNDTESGRYKPRFMADMESLDEALDAMFEPMTKANVSARFDLTLGNHENRIWRFEDSAPEVSGLLQQDFTAKVSKYGIAWHRYGKYLDIGGVKFVHAAFSVMGKPIGGVTALNTIARQTAYDIVAGHSHKGGVVMQPRLGGEQKVTVIDLGCALPQGHVASYAKHTLTGWTYGVWQLLIRNGSIQGFNFVPMWELERKYG